MRGTGGLDACNVGKTGVPFAAITGVGHGVVGKQLHLTGDPLQLMSDKLLANGFEHTAALAADSLVCWQFQKDLLLREVCGHLLQGAFLLPGMSFGGESFLCGFLCLMILLFFCFVEDLDLVLPHDIGSLFTGLTEPGPLGIGKDLVHVVQLPFRFFNLNLLFLNHALKNSHIGSSVGILFLCYGYCGSC